MASGLKQTVRTVAAAAAAALIGFAGSGRVAGAVPDKDITITPIGVYRSGHFDNGGAEIAAYDPATRRLFVVNLADARVDILSIVDPTSPVLAGTIPVGAWGSQANSVDVHDGLVAIAVQAHNKTDPGTVVFTNAYGGLIGTVAVGALPDMLTFTPNGRMVLVANEGEPSGYGPGHVDPEGTISIIDVRDGAAHLTARDVHTARFWLFDWLPWLVDPSIRVFGPGSRVSQDLEPEYITVAEDSKTAWVTLQENNAIAVIDLRLKAVIGLFGLGFKDHSTAGQGFDASDRDNHTVAIKPRPVKGMYQPDGIASVQYRGRTYLLTANEGDVREWPGLPGDSEASRVSGLTLDPTVFPDAATLQANGELGRLNVTLFNGNRDGDADHEALFSFGARSFSVWTAFGRQVYDSGDELERIVAARLPDWFNANHSNNVNLGNPNNWTHDSRSDDKGPEPETITVARLFGRQYAFIALERIGGVMIYEVTNPTQPRFVDYVNTRVFGVDAASEAAEDLGPEGLVVIAGDASPNGRPLLVVANEVSGTTRIYEIRLK